jgi:hypothetical protein
LTIAAIPYLFVFFTAEFFSTLGRTLAVGAKADFYIRADGAPSASIRVALSFPGHRSSRK